MKKFIIVLTLASSLAGCVTQPVKIDGLKVDTPMGIGLEMEGYQRGEMPEDGEDNEE